MTGSAIPPVATVSPAPTVSPANVAKMALSLRMFGSAASFSKASLIFGSVLMRSGTSVVTRCPMASARLPMES